SLWKALDDEADAREVATKNGLLSRARAEAEGIRSLLDRQKRAIRKAAQSLMQKDLFAGLGDTADAREQERQFRLDRDHMERRASAIDADLEREPAAIEALYEVRTTRLTPVGLVVSWPRS